MTPIQKPQAPHVLEIVSCTHPVRTYLEGIDKYVAWLEWKAKEDAELIAELRVDIYQRNKLNLDNGINCNPVPFEGPVIGFSGTDIQMMMDGVKETLSPLPVRPHIMKICHACRGVIGEKNECGYCEGAIPASMISKSPVPASDFTKMTETEQEQVTVVKTPEAGHSVTPLQVVSRRRGCPPGGWPKKDPAELMAKIPKVKPVNLDAPRKVKSNLRPYELLTSTDLLAILAHINRLGKKCLGMQEIADLALYLRIERELCLDLVKRYGRIHRQGKALPMILSMHHKTKGKPYPLAKLNKVAKTFDSVMLPKINPKPNEL